MIGNPPRMIDKTILCMGYESDSHMMQEKQSQFTTGLKQATKEDRGSDDFPRLPNWQPKNQTRWAYSGEY